MHVNFRDSKLTRILQPSLSGNARMAVICCATPSELFLEETRSTLQFASRAKLVKTNAQVNEVMDDRSLIRRLQQELAAARRLAGAGLGSGPAPEHVRKLEEQAQNAGTSARAAEERLRRLQSSILNGGVLFGDQTNMDPITSAKKRYRKRRHSEGNLLPPSPEKIAESVPTPRTLPRAIKKVKAIRATPLSTQSQLDLVKDALHSKTQYATVIKAKLDELARLLKSKESEIISLMCSKDILLSERDSSKIESADLMTKVGDLQAQLADTIASYEDDSKKNQKRLDDAFGKLQNELRDREDLEAALDSLQEAKLTMERAHEQELDVLRREHLEHIARNASEHTAEVREMQVRLQSSHEEEMKTQQELANLVTDENSSMKAKLVELEEEKVEMLGSLERLQGDVEDKNSECSRLENELRESVKSRDTLTESLAQSEKSFSQLSETVEELEGRLKAKEKEAESLSQVVADKEEETGAAVERQTQLENENESSRAELDKARARVEELQANVTKLEGLCEQLDEEKVELATNLSETQTRLTDIQRERDCINTKHSESLELVSNLQNQLEHKISEVKGLQTEVSDLQQVENQLRTDLDDAIQSSLQRVNHERLSAEARIGSMDSKNQGLASKLSKANNQIVSLALVVQRLNDWNEASGRRITDLVVEKEEISSKLQSTESELSIASDELVAASDKSLRLRMMLDQQQTVATGLAVATQHLEKAAEKEILQLRSQLFLVDSAKEHVEAEVQALSAELDRTSLERDTFSEQLESSRREEDKLRSQCKTLQSEVESLSNQLTGANETKTNALVRIADLEKSLQEINERADEARLAGEAKVAADIKLIASERDALSQRLAEMAEVVTTLEVKVTSSEAKVARLVSEKEELIPKPAKSLILLCSGQPLNRDVQSKQERARLILKTCGFEFKEIDGADDLNKEYRTKLFSISGLGPKYPQIFLQGSSETIFWGDWNRLEELNDDGRLHGELNTHLLVKSPSELQVDLLESFAMIKDLQVELTNSQSETKRRADELIQIHEMLEASDTRFREAKIQINSLEDELESKEHMLTQSEAARDEERSALKREVENLERNIQSLNDEARSLKEVSISSSTSKAENDELRQLLGSANHALEESKYTVSSLQTKLADSESRLQATLRALEDLQKTPSQLPPNENEDLVEMRAENENLREQLEAARESRSAFEDEQKRLRGEEQRVLIREAEITMENLRAENRALQQTLAKSEEEAYTARASVDDLRDQLGEKIQDVIQVESKLAAFENENARLKRNARRQESDLESEKASLRDELAKAKTATVDASRLSTKLKDSEHEKIRLESELKSVMDTMARLDVPALETKNRELVAEVSRLQGEIRSIEMSHLTTDGTLQKELDELREQIKAKDQRIKKLSAVKLTKEQVAAMKKLKVRLYARSSSNQICSVS